MAATRQIAVGKDEDKYAKFMSHTARRRHYYRASLDKSASVSVEPGSGAFVYQSKGLLLTAVELTGLLPVMTMYGQGKVSLSKRGLWRDLVPFLQAHAVSSSVCPARSSRSSYCSAATERTSYSVAAEGFVCIDNREDAERLLLEATVADTLYCAPRRDEQSPDVKSWTPAASKGSICSDSHAASAMPIVTGLCIPHTLALGRTPRAGLETPPIRMRAWRSTCTESTG